MEDFSTDTEYRRPREDYNIIKLEVRTSIWVGVLIRRIIRPCIERKKWYLELK